MAAEPQDLKNRLTRAKLYFEKQIYFLDLQNPNLATSFLRAKNATIAYANLQNIALEDCSFKDPQLFYEDIQQLFILAIANEYQSHYRVVKDFAKKAGSEGHQEARDAVFALNQISRYACNSNDINTPHATPATRTAARLFDFFSSFSRAERGSSSSSNSSNQKPSKSPFDHLSEFPPKRPEF